MTPVGAATGDYSKSFKIYLKYEVLIRADVSSKHEDKKVTTIYGLITDLPIILPALSSSSALFA